MEWRTLVLVVAVLLTYVGVAAGEVTCASQGDGAEEQNEVSMQTTCPVMGNPIDKSVFVDHDGKRIYVCCPPCTERFQQDPATYMKQLEDQGVVLESAPVDSTGASAEESGGT